MNARDQSIADDVGVEKSLMCTAAGCPNRWSVDAGKGRLCTAHAWSAAKDWPHITREQQDAETDRARAFSAEPEQHIAPMSHAEHIALLQRLRTVLTEPKEPKTWAYRLRARELDGQSLNDRQKTAWRAALANTPTPEEDA